MNSMRSAQTRRGSRHLLPDDCTTCGTCCFSHLLPYVAVTGDDYARLGEDAAECVSFDGYHAFMRMEDGHCASLRLTDGRFLCAVYDTRPDTCRDLARDSAACEGEVSTKGERPLLALRRKLDA